MKSEDTIPEIRTISIDSFTDEEKQLKNEFDVRSSQKTQDSKIWLKKMGYIVYTQAELDKLNLIKTILCTLVTISTWAVVILIMMKTQVYCGA